MTISIAIVYHSGFGHTKKQAEYVLKGANSISNVHAELIKAEDAAADPASLNSFDAMIFGSPTYMGSASAPFKAFMEASSKMWFKQEWKDKIAAGFTNSHSLSGDKFNTLMQMVTFAMQHGMIWAGVGELNQSPDNHAGKEDVVNRIGGFLGAMAQSENSSPDVTPPTGDLHTAELLGKRVAQLTKRFSK